MSGRAWSDDLQIEKRCFGRPGGFEVRRQLVVTKTCKSPLYSVVIRAAHYCHFGQKCFGAYGESLVIGNVRENRWVGPEFQIGEKAIRYVNPNVSLLPFVESCQLSSFDPEDNTVDGGC